MKYIKAHKPPTVGTGRVTDNSFYKTKAWKRCRASYIAGQGGICESCGDEPENPRDLHVDHVKPLSLGGEPFDEDNLQCLCRSCHSRKSMNDGSSRFQPGHNRREGGQKHNSTP
jgi:5-methylcytosine-specific restriction endonuclease McrA